MGSKVKPYFILTAEKVTNPREIEKLEAERLKKCLTPESTPPTTPAPSDVSFNNTRPDHSRHKRKKKRIVKYKIPVGEIHHKDTINKRMELIKEKLEKSRERFRLKTKQGDLDFVCEPGGVIEEEHEGNYKLDRTVTDMEPVENGKAKESNDNGNNPFVYFVVSEEMLKGTSLINENGERISSKSADKRRRVRIVEENRLKREKNKKHSQSEKMRNLAKEIGLKNSPTVTKSSTTESSPAPRKSQAAMNTIVFPLPDYETERPQTQGNQSRHTHVIHSPPRIPPCTPANTIHSDFRIDQTASGILDADDTVPRKPFLSSPLYNGKFKCVHSLSLSFSNFELPTIDNSVDQTRRKFGFGMMNSKFEDFAYPSSKPQTSEKQRKVSFAEPLPVIRGSGFVVATEESRNNFDIPGLGPRAITMGSITLPSEQTEKQTKCQRFLAGENSSQAKSKKHGIAFPLPKIDIVSNVYDEMVIKMIQNYIQDSNTPSRQSQLARELLVHLQKHNEHMKELDIVNLDKHIVRPNKNDLTKHQKKAQKLVNYINFPVPPNTAEGMIPKIMKPLDTDRTQTVTTPPEQPITADEPPKSPAANTVIQKTVPFVQITFRSKKDDDLPELPPSSRCDSLMTPSERSRSQTSEMKRRSREKTILSPVTPVSFQMAPPGLTKEDSFVAVSLKA